MTAESEFGFEFDWQLLSTFTRLDAHRTSCYNAATLGEQP